jgi:hypothetical protein
VDEVYKETNAIVAITFVYRYQPPAHAPIDAGNLVSGNGNGAGYRYQFPEVSLKVTLLVNSKTPQQAILHPILEGPREGVSCMKLCTRMLLEIQQPRLNQQSQ